MLSTPYEHKQDMPRPRIIAIVWAPEESRTAMYGRYLNAPVFYIHYLLYKRPFIAPFKYVAQAVKTLIVLFQQRPRSIFVTNPPAFAPFFVFLYAKLTGTPYIMDTHSPALYSRKWGWTVPLQRFLARHALVNIVDQERFHELFETWGAKAIVLEKPPRNFQNRIFEDIGDPSRFEITVINTFAVDEPVDIILEAARELPGVHFYILGDTALANPADLQNAPDNVTFTGYLLGRDYWNRLYSSRAVMALTTYPHSLLAGAQDGGELDKPLLLSRQPALEEYFTKGAIFIENSAAGIVEGVRALMAQEAQRQAEIADLINERHAHWQSRFEQLDRMIDAGMR